MACTGTCSVAASDAALDRGVDDEQDRLDRGGQLCWIVERRYAVILGAIDLVRCVVALGKLIGAGVGPAQRRVGRRSALWSGACSCAASGAALG